MPCPRAKGQLGANLLVRTSAQVPDEPVRVSVVQLDKVCRNEGVDTTGGHDRFKGQGGAAVPGRRPPCSALIASRPASGRPAQWGSGAQAGRDPCAPTALGFGCRGTVIG